MAENETPEGWGVVESTGLPDNIDIIITEAKFGYDASYKKGQVLLFMLTGDSPGRDEPLEQWYSTGSGWDTEDGGESAVHPDNPDGFQAGSPYGLFIVAAIQTGIDKVLAERGLPHQAEVWNGLAFHFERVDHDYGDPIGVKKFLLPTEFLGEGKKGRKAVEDRAKTKPKKGGKAKSKSKGDDLTDDQQKLLKKLQKLAGKHDDHDDFMAAAVDKFGDDVEEDPVIYALVLDEDEWELAE